MCPGQRICSGKHNSDVERELFRYHKELFF